jgi:peptidyl-prolyl cis-trans isomerase D
VLQQLRKGAAGWVAKIFFALLVLSFAVWGIEDVFRNFGSTTVATVGDTDIHVERFRESYLQEMRRLGEQQRRAVSAEEARALGLGQRVLGNLVAETALDERARQLGLSLSDEELAREIRNDPQFRGPTGSFDRLAFAAVLRNNGFTEATYLAGQRTREVRQQLIDSITADLQPPLALREALHRYLNEARTIEYVTLTPAALGEQPPPDEEALKKFYEERKSAFRAPEYRKLVLLKLDPADLAAAQEVSEEDARAAYESEKAGLTRPERRTVQQIVFPTKEEADAAAARIAAGTSFADLATERGLKPSDIDLGTVEKDRILDPAVAEAAFALAEDGTSGTVLSGFGPVLVHVTKVEPGSVQSFEEAKDKIVSDLKLRRAQDSILDAHDKIEDARAAGETLAEIAPKLGLETRSIEAIDRTGRDPADAEVADIPVRAQLLPEVFRAELGAEADPVSMGGHGFVWYELADVRPERDRTFEEARPMVEARLKEERDRELLSERANAILGKLREGQGFAEAVPGIAVQTASGITRTGGTSGLGRAAASAVFAAPAIGDYGTAVGAQPGDRIVFRVTGDSMAPFDANDRMSEIGLNQLRLALTGDLGDQYLTNLQRELGVSYNLNNVQSVIGRDS